MHVGVSAGVRDLSGLPLSLEAGTRVPFLGIVSINPPMMLYIGGGLGCGASETVGFMHNVGTDIGEQDGQIYNCKLDITVNLSLPISA